ncbi:cell division protein FtsQ/DivIB [Rhodohalobacter sp.]|uniref:cell division protein FtsQ/DivIB n=1 Tax=Rhodohalobacter sp. TaxID=1974210 RepID=UPI002ACEB398|nr:cell division protein FtsQ/DivIB [Rhodohalobacter sp.]MDZ7756977.1 cell division protein FtsQ/DivIB [Rhodohalobacter sp.]
MSKKKSHSKQNSKETKRPVTLIAGVFFIVGMAVLGGFYFEQNTKITDVDFTGHHFTSTEELEATIAEITPVGMMADSVDFGLLINSVSSLPYIVEVNVTMGYRGKLQFNVTERKPLALLMDGSKRSYVSEGGVKLPIIPEKAEDVPLVYGFAAEPLSDTLKTDAFSQVEEFLTAARENRFGWITISEVAWNEREGVVALTAENGVKLLFGHSDFETRLKHWQAFYGEVISTKGIEAFTQIDLRFRNQVVTKE